MRKKNQELKPCGGTAKKHKSLKSRIRLMINTTVLMSVVIFSVIIIILINAGMNYAQRQAIAYYQQEVQEIISQETAANNNLDTSTSNHKFYMKLDNLSTLLPILSVSLEIDDEMIYMKNASNFIGFMQNLGDAKIHDVSGEGEYPGIEKSTVAFLGSKQEVDICDANNNPIGSLTIGIDDRLAAGVYVAIIALVVFAAIIVLFAMRIVSSWFVKPILKPIDNLQKQIEQLADEDSEELNPTVISDKRTLREIRKLSDATNKLIDKMIHYNEMVTQSEKMASVGQLTAAITHEINTPLGVINSNADMMKMLTEEAIKATDQEEKEMLLATINDSADTTEEACSRIQQIIKSLRSYSRIDQADFMPADIGESMRSVVTLTTNLHKNRIKIIEDFDPIPQVSCFIGLMNQVFMNLIINAIQAIDGEGEITLRLRRDGDYVLASVIDTGCGISKKNIYRVFEYGFTTKQPGSGSGIGLALSKNIVQKHHGEIIIDSKEGQGSTITVKLPINQEHTLV